MINLLPQDIQIIRLNYPEMAIHVMVLPGKNFFVRLEEIAKAIHVSEDHVKEYLMDLPKNLQEEYPVMNCKPTLIKPNGIQVIEKITLVPFELVLSFWQSKALQHNEFAMKLASSILIQCAIENLENVIGKKHGVENES